MPRSAGSHHAPLPPASLQATTSACTCGRWAAGSPLPRRSRCRRPRATASAGRRGAAQAWACTPRCCWPQVGGAGAGHQSCSRSHAWTAAMQPRTLPQRPLGCQPLALPCLARCTWPPCAASPVLGRCPFCCPTGGAPGEAPLILGLDPATGGMERYCGLEGKVDPGQKKVPKIYHLAVHPTRCVHCCPAGLCPQLLR